MAKIRTVGDALKLPKGKLALGIFEVDVTPDDVASAAELIIGDNVGKEFYSQAEVIAYAGNKLGWGTGEGYKAF